MGQPGRAASRGRALVGPGGRLPAACDRAATSRAISVAHAQLTDADDPGTGDVKPVGRYVYEPDDAVIRAHLVTAFAAAYDGWLLDQHLAYVSSDTVRATALGRAYELIEVLALQGEGLRAALRARDIGTLTIKKRGIDVTPEALRARLRLSGTQSATIILTRTPGMAPRRSLVDPLRRCVTSRTLTSLTLPTHGKASRSTPVAPEYVDERTPRALEWIRTTPAASGSGSTGSSGTECRRSPRSHPARSGCR